MPSSFIFSSLGHCTKIQIQNFIHKVCKAFHKTVYFQNQYGVKAFNKPMFDNSSADIGEKIILKADDLYLGFDGLKDKYTLCGKSLLESPHYELMSRLYDEIPDFYNCEYVRREKYGYLDGRMGYIINKNMIDMHQNAYKKSLVSLKQGKQKEVLIYYCVDKYYILDGKHTASLCATLGKDISCIAIDIHYLQDDRYNKKILEIMGQHPDLYSKNICLLSRIIEGNSYV